MTRLYAYPYACSQAAHIALRIADLSVDIDQVDMPSKRLADAAQARLRSKLGRPALCPKGANALALDGANTAG